MILIILLCLIYFEITTEFVFIISVCVSFKVESDALWVYIKVISLMIFPVHYFSIIRTPLTAILFNHGAVRN